MDSLYRELKPPFGIKDKLAKYAKVLFGEACLISGVTLDDPMEFTKLVSELMI